jgi:hypothetical protein
MGTANPEYTYGWAPHEQLVIGLARKQRTPRVSIPLTLKGGSISTATFCGTCGRIVHHPDCPQRYGHV